MPSFTFCFVSAFSCQLPLHSHELTSILPLGYILAYLQLDGSGKFIVTYTLTQSVCYVLGKFNFTLHISAILHCGSVLQPLTVCTLHLS